MIYKQNDGWLGDPYFVPEELTPWNELGVDYEHNWVVKSETQAENGCWYRVFLHGNTVWEVFKPNLSGGHETFNTMLMIADLLASRELLKQKS